MAYPLQRQVLVATRSAERPVASMTGSAKVFRVQTTPDAITELVKTDPDKVRVMTYLRELVADGYAEWRTLEDGTIWLRLRTGETYLLANATVTRLA